MYTSHGTNAETALRDLNDTTEGFEALSDLLRVRNLAEQGIADQVRALRSIDTPWAAIALALGITKQGAQQRYGA